ncbi:MAG: M18 family aminopeptidase [Lachnospiraceae bacterium]|nr:M18 family aminopeptidase [Lachnospiraceae bacterium]
MQNDIKEMLNFIDSNPTAYHTCQSVRSMLLENGFEELLESHKWDIKPSKDYFVCRNGSSILAFRMCDDLSDYSFNIAAAHTDSPCFKIKEKAELTTGEYYTRLNTEGYGGMICSSWMDRPLSVAGRVIVNNNGSIESRLVAIDRDLMIIPNVAIHMNRDINEKASYNKQVDMLPLFGSKTEENALMKLIAKELDINLDQIVGSDLFLYIREKATVFGYNEEFIASGRLDDQQCVYGILKGLLNSRSKNSIDVAAFFDNEEVGSGTKQGAASTFLYDVLHRISMCVGKDEEDFHRAVASSFMFSADNAHAVHPNHPEYTDANNCNYMNEGIVIKSHAGQKYTSDGLSIAIAKNLAKKADVPVQYFANRSDKVGGSTLGNLAMAQVSINCVDIGLPQLAMHSGYETAGIKDTQYLIRLMEEFYKSHFKETGFGAVTITD